MIQTLNDQYYINRLIENPVNRNKWIYIDSADGSLQIVENRWYLDINIYVIQNLCLPTNVFSINLYSQFTEIDSISINTYSVEKIPEWVVQSQYCTVYKLMLSIDTNESKFFEQILTNYNIMFNMRMDIDTDVLNSAGLQIDPTDENEFITECYDEDFELSFKYSNYEQYGIDEEEINIPNSYYLNSILGSYSEDEIIYYSMNKDTDYIDDPIKQLMTINFDDEFIIVSKQIHLVYQVYGKQQKELTYESDIPEYGNSTFNLNYDHCTYYNDSSGEITNQINGVNGIYFPVQCNGYYEVILTVIYKNAQKKLKFVNNFSFKGNDDYKNKNILVQQVFIDDIDNFKELNF